MFTISNITVPKLRANVFAKELPEFYELKTVVENNDWHTNDTTFNHTLLVLDAFEELLREMNKKIAAYLAKKIDTSTRKELLFLAILFHDIAKKETQVRVGNKSSFKNHEEIGCEKAKIILERFNLSSREKGMIIDIIRHHGLIHYVISSKDDLSNERLMNFKKEHTEIFLELILLGMADTMGCQLKDNNPEDYAFRMSLYQNILEKY